LGTPDFFKYFSRASFKACIFLYQKSLYRSLDGCRSLRRHAKFFLSKTTQTGVRMKKLACGIFALINATSVLATNPQGIICREDNRLKSGSLREVILTPTPSGYNLQSQSVSSLNSRDIDVQNLATNLSCRLDDKAPMAFCTNPDGNVVFIKERREVFFDSLEPDDKKKTTKHIDISYDMNGVQKTLSFALSHCQTFGGDA
jgi:hypothetical protein